MRVSDERGRCIALSISRPHEQSARGNAGGTCARSRPKRTRDETKISRACSLARALRSRSFARETLESTPARPLVSAMKRRPNVRPCESTEPRASVRPSVRADVRSRAQELERTSAQELERTRAARERSESTSERARNERTGALGEQPPKRANDRASEFRSLAAKPWLVQARRSCEGKIARAREREVHSNV